MDLLLNRENMAAARGAASARLVVRSFHSPAAASAACVPAAAGRSLPRSGCRMRRLRSGRCTGLRCRGRRRICRCRWCFGQLAVRRDVLRKRFARLLEDRFSKAPARTMCKLQRRCHEIWQDARYTSTYCGGAAARKQCATTPSADEEGFRSHLKQLVLRTHSSAETLPFAAWLSRSAARVALPKNASGLPPSSTNLHTRSRQPIRCIRHLLRQRAEVRTMCLAPDAEAVMFVLRRLPQAGHGPHAPPHCATTHLLDQAGSDTEHGFLFLLQHVEPCTAWRNYLTRSTGTSKAASSRRPCSALNDASSASMRPLSRS